MMSRELTSGFDFWSRGHLCMAVMHLPMKFDAALGSLIAALPAPHGREERSLCNLELLIFFQN